MVKEDYHNILVHHMKPSMAHFFPQNNGIFQQDSDPKHTAHIIRDYLGRQAFETLDWPSQSPDLNPIENLWSILDDKLKYRKSNTPEELFKTIEDGWYDLPASLLTKLVESMPRRCQAVIDSNGYATKY